MRRGDRRLALELRHVSTIKEDFWDAPVSVQAGGDYCPSTYRYSPPLPFLPSRQLIPETPSRSLLPHTPSRVRRLTILALSQLRRATHFTPLLSCSTPPWRRSYRSPTLNLELSEELLKSVKTIKKITGVIQTLEHRLKARKIEVDKRMGPSVAQKVEEAMLSQEAASSSNFAPGPSSTAAPKTSSPDYIPQITDALDKLTTHAASLPPKSDLSFHRTLDRKFAKSLDITSSKLLVLTERLLRLVETTPGPSGAKASASKGKGRSALVDEEDAVEGFRRSVGSVIDGLLEDAVSPPNVQTRR